MVKTANWVNFMNNVYGIISILLLPHNRIFAAYITIGSLLLAHNEASEKIIPFTICSNFVKWQITITITQVRKMFISIKQLHPSHWPFNHYFAKNGMFIIRFTLCSWRGIHSFYCCLSKAYKHTCHIAPFWGNKEQLTKFTEYYDITSSLWNHNKNLNGFCCCIVPWSCVSKKCNTWIVNGFNLVVEPHTQCELIYSYIVISICDFVDSSSQIPKRSQRYRKILLDIHQVTVYT